VNGLIIFLAVAAVAGSLAWNVRMSCELAGAWRGLGKVEDTNAGSLHDQGRAVEGNASSDAARKHHAAANLHLRRRHPLSGCCPRAGKWWP
jgi:hypothetical protein